MSVLQPLFRRPTLEEGVQAADLGSISGAAAGGDAVQGNPEGKITEHDTHIVEGWWESAESASDSSV